MPKRIPSAPSIIKAMQKLLTERHHLRVTRRHFIRRWGELRKQLNSTPEYLRFKHAVVKRSKGFCERKCGRTGSVVHHVTPVAYDPAQALDPVNGEHLCRPCHAEEHPQLRLSA